MKKIVMTAIVCVLASTVFGQNEVKIEQIVKLKIYLGLLQKGYEIVDHGLSVINNIKHGDFDLHLEYFNSLLSVKAAIEKGPKVDIIRSQETRLQNLLEQMRRQFLTSNVFTDAERVYLAHVIQAVQSDVLSQDAALQTVIADAALAMTDAERSKRIDQITQALTSTEQFLLTWNRGVQTQIQQRTNEKAQLLQLQKLIP